MLEGVSGGGCEWWRMCVVEGVVEGVGSGQCDVGQYKFWRMSVVEDEGESCGGYD